DDLQLVAQAGLEERQKEAVRVEAIIEEEVERAMKWWQLEAVVPTITALQYKAEAVRRREVARSLKKLTPLSPQAE
ncbi:MAG: glutamyl-tRNA reductase, partial [Chloroflexota bacterium]